MYKIVNGKNKTIEEISLEYYDKLNPYRKGKTTKRKDAIERVIKSKLLNKSDELRYNFYNELSRNKFFLLKNIITGDVNVLFEIIMDFEEKVSNEYFLPFYAELNGVISLTDFGNEILNLFNYKKLRRSEKIFWLKNELDISVCPYCNYEYTFEISNGNKKMLLHDFDHYFPKVLSPYLSISFYNLIPSCHNCNSHLKGTNFLPPAINIHPYVDDFDSWSKFSINNAIFNDDINSFNVIFKSVTNDTSELDKCINHQDLFQLEARYNNLKNDVLWLHRFKEKYSPSQKLQYMNEGLFGRVFDNHDELNKYIYKEIDIAANNNNNRNKSKGKLIQDLSQEFGLFEF